MHGGGNTSTKLTETDWRGRERRVLRVKGSGTDLATIDRSGFPGLYLDGLDVLRDRAAMSDEEMVEYLAHCMREPGGRPPSIETLLHAWLPAAHVDHTHADAICALSNHPAGRAVLVEALGPDVAVVPYIRPGFELSRQVAELADARAIVLDHHGLVTWGDDHDESLGRTLELDLRAREFLDSHAPAGTPRPRADLSAADTTALLAALRDSLTAGRTGVLHVDRRQRALADRADVRAVATSARSTPDHILRIGPASLVVETAADVAEAVARFAGEYRAYFDRHRGTLPTGQAMHDPRPSVVLVPGLGCVTVGATPAVAAVRADLSLHSHGVTARVLDVFGAVRWLDEASVFSFDYWPLELRKLTGSRVPPSLTGRVAVVDLDDADAIRRCLTEQGAVVATSTAAAHTDLGGLDVVVTSPTRLREHLPAAHAGASLVLVCSADEPPRLDAAPGLQVNAITGRPTHPELLADAVGYLAAQHGLGTTGSVLRLGGRAG